MTLQRETPVLRILGCRGVPAAHGGFETFAERLSLHLVARGWRVVVYCQDDAKDASGPERLRADSWRGVERVHIRPSQGGPLGTMEFDWLSIRHAGSRDGVCLVLGYNTGLFLPWLRLKGRPVLTNMDGIEWRRPKWSRPVQAWFYLNERVAALASHRLIADHPAIADHLATRRSRRAIVTIPYGGDPVLDAPTTPVEALGLQPGRYLISIARIEPDNNVLPLVQAFSRRPRGTKLVVLGKLDDGNAHHRAVRAAASAEVLFPGAIYEAETVKALRFHARAYLHGHSVGGTNPSLVESLWCGSAVLAHKNPYNVWTAGAEQFFFSDRDECERWMDAILADDAAVGRARAAARARTAADFSWEAVLDAYEREIAALGRYERPRVPAGAVPPADIYDLGARPA